MEDLLSPDKLLSFAINIGASFAAAWSAFLWLGRKWIESRLSKELEYHKAVHAQELEKLKHRMSATFDRLTRLHDREFEVLPDIWGKLVEVRRWAGGYVSSVKSYPNVANLEDYALQEQLDKLGFEEWQKTEILESDNRQDTFNAACDEIHYEDVKEKISEFYDFFRRKSIFIHPPIKEDIRNILNLIHSAVEEQYVNPKEDRRRLRTRKRRDALEKEGVSLLTKIEDDIANRLWEAARQDVK